MTFINKNSSLNESSKIFKSHPLINKYFHYYTPDGLIGYQGKVLDVYLDSNGTSALVQFYSWVDGRATDQIYMPIKAMRWCLFYDTQEEWNERYKQVTHPNPVMIRHKGETDYHEFP